jgi:hypothetical protein
MRALSLALFAAGLLAAGCSLFGNYNLEGLPCDPSARAGEECLPDAGYVCVCGDGGAGTCVRTK